MFRLALRATCFVLTSSSPHSGVVAMTLLGFRAHKPIYFTPNGLDLCAYATPDGTLLTICGQTDRGAPCCSRSVIATPAR